MSHDKPKLAWGPTNTRTLHIPKQPPYGIVRHCKQGMQLSSHIEGSSFLELSEQECIIIGLPATSYQCLLGSHGQQFKPP